MSQIYNVQRDLSFVTSNVAKFETAATVFRQFSKNLIQQPMEMQEIQAGHSDQVVAGKVESLRDLIDRPFFVEDGSFHITALNGFPGVYTKYVLATIGISGLLKLLEGEHDRRCYFHSAVGYCSEDGEVRFFRSRREGLSVGSSVSSSAGDGWSEIWRILALEGSQVPLWDEPATVVNCLLGAWKRDNSFYQLAAWLNSRS